MSKLPEGSSKFQHFVPCSKSLIAEHLLKRSSETKLGEDIFTPDGQDLETFLKSTPARFVIVGVAEDIGVLANQGRPGADTTWFPFLTAFVNLQRNAYTNFPIAIIGHFEFEDLKKRVQRTSVEPEVVVENYRNAVAEIDAEVTDIIRLIVEAGKIPIVIGGGHNNAYPIIKGVSQGIGSAINAINLDAHIDYRVCEGRHSGNGFRYAKEEEFLKKYFVVGLHESYLPESIRLELADNPDVNFLTFEDIFVRNKLTWEAALNEACVFIGSETPTGFEVDLDCLMNADASAATPVGLMPREALRFLYVANAHTKAVYLHVCEGISSQYGRLTGKLIAYLVAEFIRSGANGG